MKKTVTSALCLLTILVFAVNASLDGFNDTKPLGYNFVFTLFQILPG